MPTFQGNRQALGVPSTGKGLAVVRNFLLVPVIDTQKDYTISGQTLDSAGAAKTGATLYLFTMFNGLPTLVGTTVSDGSGNYSFTVTPSQNYWITDYKSGSPDVAGATLQTLQGV